jgi:hypothetical protein
MQKTKALKQKHDLLLDTDRYKQEIEQLQLKLLIEATMTPENIKKLVLDTVQQIYKNLEISELKIVHMGEGQGLENLIAQIATVVNTTTEKLSE